MRKIIMIKVKVNGRVGETTSILPHSSGKFPVWFNSSKTPKFIDAKDVEFI